MDVSFILPFPVSWCSILPSLPAPAPSRPTVHPHLVEILESHARLVCQKSGACKWGDIYQYLIKMFLSTIIYHQHVDLWITRLSISRILIQHFSRSILAGVCPWTGCYQSENDAILVGDPCTNNIVCIIPRQQIKLNSSSLQCNTVRKNKTQKPMKQSLPQQITCIQRTPQIWGVHTLPPIVFVF